MALEGARSEMRRSPREPVTLGATLRQSDYHGMDAIVRDLSGDGFVAEVEGEFPVGAFVRLKLPGLGTVMAQVRWGEHGRVGGEFVTPIPLPRLHRALGIGVHPVRAVAG